MSSEKLKKLESERRSLFERKAIGTVVAVVIVVVIVAIGAGAYFATTMMPSGQSTQNTTTSSQLSTSSQTTQKQISTVVVDIVSGAHLQSQAQHFVPQTIVVEIGVNNTIQWVNQDSAPHTVTSNAAGIFNSNDINPSSTFSFTFTTPGTYLYHCNIHPFMTGTVVVLNSNGQSVSTTFAGSSTTSHTTTTGGYTYPYGY
jgi:plastocyanin